MYLKWYRTLCVVTEMGFEVGSRLHIKIQVSWASLLPPQPVESRSVQMVEAGEQFYSFHAGIY